MSEELDQLLSELSQEGDLDSSGSFSIDPVAARVRYRQYLVSDARLYLCRLARAAVLSGAESLHCQYRNGEVIAHCPQLLCSHEQLPRLLDPLEGAHTDPLKQLAIALLLAVEAGGGLVELTLAGLEGGRRLRFRPESDTEIEQLPPGPLSGTYLRVQYARPDRLAWLRTPKELVYLKERFRFASTPIWIGREPVRVDWSAQSRPRGIIYNSADTTLVPRFFLLQEIYYREHHTLQIRYPGSGIYLLTPSRANLVIGPAGAQCGSAIALYCDTSLGYQMLLLHSGEMVATLPRKLTWGAEAVADASALPLDLAGETLVEGHAYHELVAQMEERLGVLTAQLAARYPKVRKGDYRGSLIFDKQAKGHRLEL